MKPKLAKELFQNCSVGARAYTLDQVDLSTPIGQPNIYLDREFYEEGQEPFIECVSFFKYSIFLVL